MVSRTIAGSKLALMHPELGEALQLLYDKQLPESPYEPVIISERGNRMKPNVIVHWFKRFYSDLGFDDCSSHSGRRTLATNSARNLSRAGASLKDLQDLGSPKPVQYAGLPRGQFGGKEETD